MSYHDYKKSQEIAAEGYTFYALIMAAMRKADTDNLSALTGAFPKVHDELIERYNAPGGLVKDELDKLGYEIPEAA